MSTESYITLVLSLVINSLLFGSTAVVILATPALATNAATLIPFAVAASILLTAPIAVALAPRVRLRNQRVAALRSRYRR